jgi:hypothetical protein
MATVGHLFRPTTCAFAITQRHFASRRADQRAATHVRWPHNRLALGDCSFRAGPVRERMVAHPRRGTAERLHAGSAPDSPINRRDDLGRHGASLGLADDRREPAAFPAARHEAASRHHSGNKSDPLAVLLTRRGNGYEPAKRRHVPDTSGISQLHFRGIVQCPLCQDEPLLRLRQPLACWPRSASR